MSDNKVVCYRCDATDCHNCSVRILRHGEFHSWEPASLAKSASISMQPSCNLPFICLGVQRKPLRMSFTTSSLLPGPAQTVWKCCIADCTCAPMSDSTVCGLQASTGGQIAISQYDQFQGPYPGTGIEPVLRSVYWARYVDW